MFKVNQDTYARVFARLIAEPATARQLAEETGLHVVTVQNLMRCFKKHKLVHVTDWDQDTLGRDRTPIYIFGKGKDKAKYCKSSAEKAKSWRDSRRIAAIPTSITQMPAHPCGQ